MGDACSNTGCMPGRPWRARRSACPPNPAAHPARPNWRPRSPAAAASWRPRGRPPCRSCAPAPASARPARRAALPPKAHRMSAPLNLGQGLTGSTLTRAWSRVENLVRAPRHVELRTLEAWACCCGAGRTLVAAGSGHLGSKRGVSAHARGLHFLLAHLPRCLCGQERRCMLFVPSASRGCKLRGTRCTLLLACSGTSPPILLAWGQVCGCFRLPRGYERHHCKRSSPRALESDCEPVGHTIYRYVQIGGSGDMEYIWRVPEAAKKSRGSGCTCFRQSLRTRQGYQVAAVFQIGVC